MKRRILLRARRIPAVWLLGVVLLASAGLAAAAAAPSGSHSQEPAAPDASQALALVGTVKLEWATTGLLTDDPLPRPTPAPGVTPPNLGEIDLGLNLVQTGNDVSGYVDLDATMVFTGTTTGPRVTGTFDGATLSLLSGRFIEPVGGRQLQRQFRLTGATVAGQPEVVTGQYRETIWGYGPKPLTVVGTFTLQRGIAKPLQEHSVYLPLILRK